MAHISPEKASPERDLDSAQNLEKPVAPRADRGDIVHSLIDMVCEDDRAVAPDLGTALAVEDERLRLVANVAVAVNLSPQSLLLRKSIPGLSVDALEHFCVMHSGAQCARLGCFMSVILPTEIPSPEKTFGALTEVHRAVEGIAHWVIDLSTVTTFSSGFLDALSLFHRVIRSTGGNASLVWVESKALDQETLKKLSREYSSFKKNRFFQTRALPSLSLR